VGAKSTVSIDAMRIPRPCSQYSRQLQELPLTVILSLQERVSQARTPKRVLLSACSVHQFENDVL
jgi:hypothetical protein